MKLSMTLIPTALERSCSAAAMCASNCALIDVLYITSIISRKTSTLGFKQLAKGGALLGGEIEGLHSVLPVLSLALHSAGVGPLRLRPSVEGRRRFFTLFRALPARTAWKDFESRRGTELIYLSRYIAVPLSASDHSRSRRENHRAPSGSVGLDA